MPILTFHVLTSSSCLLLLNDLLILIPLFLCAVPLIACMIPILHRERKGNNDSRSVDKQKESARGESSLSTDECQPRDRGFLALAPAARYASSTRLLAVASYLSQDAAIGNAQNTFVLLLFSFSPIFSSLLPPLLLHRSCIAVCLPFLWLIHLTRLVSVCVCPSQR